jgi:putative FmdB family regulatory protein
MPIYEYRCEDCGKKFEKLVRRAGETEGLECPGCGQTRLKQEFSTFAAHANGSSKQAGVPPCANGGSCPGSCGMNFG